MPAKITLGIVSQIAGGKTIVTEYLEQKYNARTFRFSDMLRDVLKRMRLAENRANMQTLSTVLRQNFGQDIMSRVIAADVLAADDDLIVTEGIRRPSDALELKKLPDFYIIAIQSDMRTRFERLASRHDNPDDQTTTWADFQAQAKEEAELRIEAIAREANFVIENNGTLAELHSQVDEVMDKLLNG